MAQDFGNGVSRTLSAADRQYQVVIWRANKPPLDSELALMTQLDWERAAETIRAQAHSGFLLDPMAAETDFQTDEDWSNWFRLGNPDGSDLSPILWANVNGWVIPVTGTASAEGDTSNRIDLFPPPASSSRVDLVFLEVWLAHLDPNPSTTNKPSADAIWRYGNVKYGGDTIPDDLEDPAIGFETTARLQIQYRIRVVGQGPAGGTTVDLATFPDGLDDPNILAQGAADAPLPGVTWTNMRNTLGDPGLWRAGNGDPTNSLGTIDGYAYAIPICAVFRRNSSDFVALTAAGNANQNGALERNPVTVSITDPAEASRTFSAVTLVDALDADTAAGVSDATIQVIGLDGSGLDNANIDWTSTFLMLEDEIVGVSSVDTSVSPNTITLRAGGRGRYGTVAAYHAAGTAFRFYNPRPDGLFSDQIAAADVLDLRKGVTLGEWDYNQILAHNLSKLFQGRLRSSYKQSGVSDTEGPTVLEVASISTGATVPNQTESLDGPDGIRTSFSDAVVVQNDVTLLLGAPTSAGAITTFVSGDSWEVGAGFVPSGYATGTGWNNDTIIDLYIGGSGGSDGARASMRGERAVRFASPHEMWLTESPDDGCGDQHPTTLSFLGGDLAGSPDNVGIWSDPASPGGTATEHPGPMYPLRSQDFVYPFLFLGGVVNDLLGGSPNNVSVESTGTSGGDYPEVIIAGANFDTEDVFWSQADSAFADDPTALSQPLIHGTRTLWSMITADGRDVTGASSELFVVIRGDTTNPTNNGVWRVIGAGTNAGKPNGQNYTTANATAADRLAVERVAVGGAADFADAANLTGVVRSQTTHTEDGLTSTTSSAAVVVITDIEATLGNASNPWNSANLGAGAITAGFEGDLLLSLSLTYGPGRGGVARVADAIDRFGMVSAPTTFLRQSPAAVDTAFPAEAGVPDDQTWFPIQNLQTWNRLDSRGLHAPEAPAYGGSRQAYSEMSREAEVFVDPGSKTVMFRPYQRLEMTMVMRDTASTLIPTTYPSTITVDGAGIFATGTNNYSLGYPIPRAYMPRFGRQDIPYHRDLTGNGTGSFLEGINHLFRDQTTETAQMFNVVGGNTNSGVAGVRFMFAQTIPTATTLLAWGEWGAVPGGTPYADGNGYQARLLTPELVSNISSDVPRGLRGIQLPPFLGVARLIAVYDSREWDGQGAYNNDRVTPLSGVNVPTNLLRADADKRTLFILQGGGEDLTNNADDHTYVIPEDVIDITRSGSWSAGEDFEDISYIVQFEAFGFARGFINKNNYVLAREFDGNGDAPDVVATPMDMILPAAAPLSSSSQAFAVYRRTVYQGDPYMTRDGDTRTTSDYEYRYGQVAVSDAFEIGTPIQQFDSTSDYSQVPEKVNPRALEVLAYADFVTTLGTGKMGGLLYAGTPTDAGHLSSVSSRIPATASDAPFQPHPRALTERQTAMAPRASLSILITDYTSLADTAGPSATAGTTITVRRGANSTTYTAVGSGATGNEFLASTDNATTALALWQIASADPILDGSLGVKVEWGGGGSVRFVARDPGAEGNEIYISIRPGDASSNARTPEGILLVDSAASALTGAFPMFGKNSAHLSGGVDLPVNAAAHENAPTPVGYTGLTERLPLGILVQDSDFIGEDILRDGSSALRVSAGVSGVAAGVDGPLIENREYSRPPGAGSFLGMSDGSILRYAAYDMNTEPTGTRRFRTYRGGSLYSLDPLDLGGPVDWAAPGFPKGVGAVLKGAAIVGRAYLVRNYPETALAANDVTSHGDEIQMVIATHTVYGTGPNSPGYAMTGRISPTGYGKGYAAADRYRLEGKPFVPGHSKTGPNPDVELAPYPNEDPADVCVCP